MSSADMGAASAAPAVRPEDLTPALADQWETDALESIEVIQDPAEAERLLAKTTACGEAVRLAKLGEDRERRWRVVRLRAERRYGELLPPKKPGPKSSQQPVTNSEDRMAQSRARKVAAVPVETFEDYVTTAPAPSREGLLRTAPPKRKYKRRGEPTVSGRAALSHDPEVITWVRGLIRAGWGREEIVAASRGGTEGWPRPGESLTNGGVTECRAAIATAERLERELHAPKRGPRESGKRLRQLHADKRAGRSGDLWHLQKAVAEAVGMLERFDLPELDWSEETEAMVVEIYDDLERHARWNDAAIDAVTAHMGELGRQRKIKALRARADDPSSTTSERATAVRLAERLERRRSATRLSTS